MTLTETRVELVAAIDHAKLNLARAEGALWGFDLRHSIRPEKPARRDLRAEVLAQLTDTPQSAETIRYTVGGRLRDVENILRRSPMHARCRMGAWVRVETETYERMAAE